MPRRPSRKGQIRKPQPSFSRFARSMALVSSIRKVKQQNDNSVLPRKVHSNSSGIKTSVNNSSNGSKKEKAKAMKTKREEVDSSSGNEDSSSEEDFEGVQADFAFFDPKPDDFHGVKLLLQTYLDGKEWDQSGFVDLILQQTTVGTVVKMEEDEDNGVYGFVTALNLHRYKDHKCMMELKEYLLKVCEDKDVKDSLRSYLEEQAAHVGLLISQRVVNLPPQLLPPLYDGLFDEISWAIEDEPSKELRKSFCFKYYLIVSKIYKLNGNQKKKGSSSSEEAIIYVKPEDEIFHNLSAWSFCFPLCTQKVTPNELKNYKLMGLVIAVEACKVPAFKEQLHSLIEEP